MELINIFKLHVYDLNNNNNSSLYFAGGFSFIFGKFFVFFSGKFVWYKLLLRRISFLPQFIISKTSSNSLRSQPLLDKSINIKTPRNHPQSSNTKRNFIYFNITFIKITKKLIKFSIWLTLQSNTLHAHTSMHLHLYSTFFRSYKF